MAQQKAPTLKQISEMKLPELYGQLGRMRYAASEIEGKLESDDRTDAEWRRKAILSLEHFRKAEKALGPFIACQFSSHPGSELIYILNAMTEIVCTAQDVVDGIMTEIDLKIRLEEFYLTVASENLTS